MKDLIGVVAKDRLARWDAYLKAKHKLIHRMIETKTELIFKEENWQFYGLITEMHACHFQNHYRTLEHEEVVNVLGLAEKSDHMSSAGIAGAKRTYPKTRD